MGGLVEVSQRVAQTRQHDNGDDSGDDHKGNHNQERHNQTSLDFQIFHLYVLLHIVICVLSRK